MATMRLKITERLHGCIDGMRLDWFQLGAVYDVGTMLAAVLLAEGWAEPADSDAAALAAPGGVFLFGRPTVPQETEGVLTRPPPLRLAEAADTSPRPRSKRKKQKQSSRAKPA